ncbi:MAG: replicative DNA helicase [Actinobacteria bacterium]|nr:replicative DNA helicase [Actinomycetota bacterium]
MSDQSASSGRPARVPPSNLDAEQSLLGAMLLAEHAISASSTIVQADDFYKPAHRHIFEAIQSLYGSGRGVDPLTVADELDRAGVLEAVGGPATLLSLQANTPAITNAEHYARIVEEKALLRKLIGAANDVAELGYSPLDDIEKTIDTAESMIFSVAQRRTTDTLAELAPLLDRTLEQLEELYERGDAITGTPTGFTDLDSILSGLQPGALIVVGARPAMGKSALALGLASHAAVREQLPVMFFSLEMSHLELTQRLLAAEARVDATKLRTGRLTDADWTKITKAMGRLGEAPLWIDDNPALTVMEIRSKARRLQDKLGTNLGLIVVDYLQLMQGRARVETRQVEVAEISRGLKVLARELEVPVVALSQLSRQLELRADKRPMLADLRESGCLTASTKVLRADDNSEVSLGDLLAAGERDVPVWSLDDDWKLVPATMTHVFPSGVKDVFRLRLSSGRTVDASANHPFRCLDRWARLDELSAGDRVAVPRRVGRPESTRALADVLGAHLPVDGLERVEEIARLADAAARSGFLVDGIESLADEDLAELLAHHWTRLGAISTGTLRGRPLVRLYCTSRHRELLIEMQRCLLRFEVHARLVAVSGRARSWRLWIHGVDDQRRFLRQVGLVGPTVELAREALGALSDVESNSNVDTIPPSVRDLIVEELARLGTTQRELAAAIGEAYCGSYFLGTESRPRSTSRARLGRIAAACDSKELAAVSESDVLWDEVVSIEPLGPQPVFDATVLGTHNFVADGVIVHNSIEQDADVVMFLYRDEVYHPDSPDKDTAELLITKHRSGRTGMARLVFLDYCTMFANMASGD